jgi:hypothetical protein
LLFVSAMIVSSRNAKNRNRNLQTPVMDQHLPLSIEYPKPAGANYGQSDDTTYTDHAERAISAWFLPSNTSVALARNTFTESDLRSVSDILYRAGKQHWSKIPRTYSTLRMVNQLELIDAFITQGLSDTSFPFTLQTLPEELRSPSKRLEFLEAQKLVLTKSLDLEREAGKHHHFLDQADIPFSKLAELGKGGYGYVDRVISTISHKEYARKLIPRGRTFKKDKKVLQDFENELATLKRLRHHHIISLIGSYTDPKFVGIIMSPVADCNLKEFLEAAPLSLETTSILQTFFGCLAAVLCYLHDNRIRHKDIKPQNVLVHRNRVLLTDFGHSLDWSERQHSTTSGITIRTPKYCAPEVANFCPRNSSSDIWSLGCVFLEIWTVLNAETVSTLDNHLCQNGSFSTCYYLNSVAVDSWCCMVTARSNTTRVNTPRLWIYKMMQENPQDRWTARMLYDQIQEVNEDPEVSVLFIGTCCIADIESATSTYSEPEECKISTRSNHLFH